MYPGAIFKSSLFYKVIFGISLFLLLFISSISYTHTKALNASSELVMHSYKIQVQLEHVLSVLKDAETGQRGFIISHDTVLLKPYNSARDIIYRSYFKLKTLTVDNRTQEKNLDTLFQLINLRFELLAYTLECISVKPINEKQLDKNLIHGQEVMDNIRTQIDKMDVLETLFLKDHKIKYEKEVTFSPISIFLFMILSLLVFILSYIKINNDLQVLKKSNDELLITNESIKHAEIIGLFCISQWDLVTNKLTYSDNLYRLLGCEPQSFEPNVENYLKFVHPDDRYIVAKAAESAIKQSKIYPRYYRIIRNDGETRYFMSMGKLISDNDNKIHIGIIKDITEYHLSNIALEGRNHELEQSIKELESFNRVASHDLQEPLRIIQTFISRITEKDKANLSNTGKEYLSKIDSSAKRMRNLIDDLILFSRTNKSEKVFDKTDLNVLLENAKQELAQNIQEKNAVIQSVQLPILNVIAFQIQQLLVNLIGNALKYSKPDIFPLIKIDCKKLEAKHYPDFITDTDKKYYKITISDNGMGFDQEYAEKIFTLFYRLHQKFNYPGSGIGLSICKKIIENHNGFLIAEGKPDIGATFIVYLPA